MWYRKASSDEYDLTELNRDVRVDQAMEAIGRGLSTGEEVDLSPLGFKAIKVNTLRPQEPLEDEGPIDPRTPRDNFQQFEGIDLDHPQGIAFAAQALQRNYTSRILSTFNVIWEDFLGGSPSIEPFWQRLKALHQLLEDLNEDAQMRMTRSQDFDQSWAARGKSAGNIPIWSGQHPLNREYNQALDQNIDQENRWSAEKAKEFWAIWSELRKFMFEFKPYIPFGPYWKLWDELTPI
jgi:hypothetical protein